MCQPGRPLPHGDSPERLSGLGGLPEREVERVFLDVVDVDARAGLQIFDRLVAELAVVLEFQRAVVHVAVDLIGVALIDERCDEVDDLLNVFGGLRVHGRLADAERVGVGEVFGDVFFRDFLARDALFVGALDDLVVHVGEILHERHLVAAVLEIAAQHIKHDDRARVADVDEVIHRRTAGVHAHLAGLDRHELFLLHGHGVEQFHIQTPLTDEFGIKKRPHAVRHERRSYFAVPLSFFHSLHRNAVPSGGHFLPPRSRTHVPPRRTAPSQQAGRLSETGSRAYSFRSSHCLS